MPIIGTIALHRPDGGALDSKQLTPTSFEPFTHGEIMEIEGIGFGNMPMFAFAGGKVGRIEQATLGADNVDAGGFFLSSGNPKLIENDSTRGKVWKATVFSGGQNADNGVIAHDWGSDIVPGSKIFRHAVTKINCDAPYYQWKFWRQEPNFNWEDGGPESFTMFWKKDVGRYYGVRPAADPGDARGRMTYLSGAGANAIRMDGTPTWFSLDYYNELSSLGGNDGSDYGTASSDTGITPLYDLTGTMHIGSEVTDRPRWQVLQNYLGNYNEGSPTVGEVWIDDFYVQVAPPGEDLVRAFITNSAVFSASTIIPEIQQPHVTWTNNRASVRINRGGLVNGHYWLHVVKNKDTVVASKSFSIGS